jgi:hypothetical protein
MLIGYRAGLALTSLLLLLCTAASPASTSDANKRRAAQVAATHRPAVDQLYSARALRRARTILQLKLLELRSERLERVRKAIESGVPIDVLLNHM